MSSLTRAPLIIARASSRNASSHAQDSHAIWKEINRLGSEGKWDSINNKPKVFLYGSAKKEANAAYSSVNTGHGYFESSPYGPYVKLIWRVALLFGIIKAGVLVYDTVVPEQKRLKYKYRHHNHDEHGQH